MEVPVILQFIAVLVAIAGGIALPFVLFILADMRGRISTLFALVNQMQTQNATHSAQLSLLLAEMEFRRGAKRSGDK